MEDSDLSKRGAGPTRHLQAEIAFLKKVKLSLDNPDVYQEFLLVLKAHRDRKISTKEMLAKVNEFFAGRDELAQEFKTFLKPKTRADSPATNAPTQLSATDLATPQPNVPSIPPADSVEDTKGSNTETPADEHRDFLVHAQRLVQLIKGYYSDRPDIYQGFLQLLKQYVHQSIPFERVAIKVGDLFVDHPGLIEAFAAFLPDHRSKALRQLAEEKKRELEASSRRLQAKSTKATKRRLLEGYEKKVNSGTGRTLRSNADPEWTETVNGERQHRWGPSYVILSDEKVQAKHKYSSGRDKLGWSVLNDRMVCTQNGSEAYKDSFKTPYEDVLFKIEDDQFELDITIGKCLSTIEHLHDMQKAIADNNFNMDALENGDFPVIGPLQRIALKLVFRDGFDTVMEVLRQQPLKFMSDFFPRLIAQTDHWIKARYSWRGIWRNAQRRSYPRSLDYQGAFFKQDEIRKTNPKWIVSQARKAVFDAMLQGTEPDFHARLQFPRDCATSIEVSLKMLEKVAYKLFPSGSDAQQAVALVEHLCSKVVLGQHSLDFFATQAHYIVLNLIHLLLEKVALARTLVSFDSSLFDFSRVLEPQPDTQWLHMPVQEIELHGLPPIGSVETAASAERDSPVTSAVAPTDKDQSDPDAMEVDAAAKVDPSSSDDDSGDSVDSGVPDGVPAPRRSRRGGDNSPAPFGYIPEGLAYDSDDPLLKVHTDRKFETYLDLLERLVEGNLDQQSYEEACLRMLGPKCFPLFTVHSALMQLARQAKNIVATSELSAASKLVARFVSTPDGDAKELLDAIVRSTKGVVRLAHFRFHGTRGQLFVKLLSLPGESELVSPRDRWVNYITAFVASDPMNMIATDHRVYLQRNKRAAATDLVPPICIRNDGMEAVVRSKDFHLVFVEGTSDFLMKTRADLAPPLRVPGPIQEAFDRRQATLKRSASLSQADRSHRLSRILNKLVKS
eukprot:TRINITY_DN5161_c0_g1_i1.p1 TRINITY_DN5161_c0_g1~~TRINITY_DN5161_c0_g1_i1.p1  ORF type:complete len:956 (+),score=124.05 TRINITY_DN5161_c0_g1_i1:112-2979(+)